jgi:hypothetical protein
LKAAVLYLFCLNVLLKCWITSFRHSVSHIVLAQLMNVVSTACFCDGWWCDCMEVEICMGGYLCNDYGSELPTFLSLKRQEMVVSHLFLFALWTWCLYVHC